jgi:hypothetical protein
VRRSPTPVTYQLADSNGEVIRGRFYAHDLSLVKLPPPPPVAIGRRLKNSTLQYDEPTWSIERILDHEKRSGGVEYCLVKWTGFPASENRWIPAQSIIDRS